MGESFVNLFEKIFEMVPRREFMKDPTIVLMHMSDQGFDDGQIRLLESALSEKDVIGYLLGYSDRDLRSSEPITGPDMCGYTSSLLKDLKSAFESNYRTDAVEMRCGVRRQSSDGRAWFSSDMKKLLRVTDAVDFSIPDTVVEISYHAFAGCRSLKTIVIPESVVEIGDGAFERCSSLEEVSIPDSVKAIGFGAFNFCENVRITVDEGNENYSSVDGALIDRRNGALLFGNPLVIEGRCRIPSTVKAIEMGAFIGCADLREISIPDSVEILYPWSFFDCGRMAFDVDVENQSYSSENGALFDKRKMTLIMGSALVKEGSCSIPPSVREIGDMAFFGDKELQGICISDKVQRIGESSFENCTSLREASLSDSLKEIGPRVFYGCISLEKIRIPRSARTIGKEAFGGCRNLREIDIPRSVEEIDFEAFNGCVSVSFDVTKRNEFFSSVHGALFGKDGHDLYSGHSLVEDGICSLSQTVMEIHSCAFKGCTTLESIDIPDSVRYIRMSVFSGCTSLRNVRLPEHIDRISMYSFEGCTSLTEITIPDAVKKIENRAFQGCTALKEIRMPDSISRIGAKSFQGCFSIESFKIPKRVKKIEGESFEDCISLKEIHIPSSVSTISRAAFKGCSSLEKVHIPASVQDININAFLGCDGAVFTVDPNNGRYSSIEGRLYDKKTSTFMSIRCTE